MRIQLRTVLKFNGYIKKKNKALEKKTQKRKKKIKYLHSKWLFTNDKEIRDCDPSDTHANRQNFYPNEQTTHVQKMHLIDLKCYT